MGYLSYRQMLMQGIIQAPPPFDPPIDNDPMRELRRQKHLKEINKPRENPVDPGESAIDYGRPLMRLGNEEKLREVLTAIQTPVLILGGVEDSISTPDLMIRTAKCLSHCKLVIYSNCGHNIDTDLIEETVEETIRFLDNVDKTGKVYQQVME